MRESDKDKTYNFMKKAIILTSGVCIFGFGTFVGTINGNCISTNHFNDSCLISYYFPNHQIKEMNKISMDNKYELIRVIKTKDINDNEIEIFKNNIFPGGTYEYYAVSSFVNDKFLNTYYDEKNNLYVLDYELENLKINDNELIFVDSEEKEKIVKVGIGNFKKLPSEISDKISDEVYDKAKILEFSKLDGGINI